MSDIILDYAASGATSPPLVINAPITFASTVGIAGALTTNNGIEMGGRKQTGQLVPSVRAYSSVPIAVATNTATTIPLDLNRWDTDNIHSTTVNNSRFTTKTAGKYIISATVQYASNATGYRSINFKLNGATTIGVMTVPSVGTDVTELSLTTLYDLAVNDYIELIGFQISGGSLNINAVGNRSVEVSMVRIG